MVQQAPTCDHNACGTKCSNADTLETWRTCHDLAMCPRFKVQKGGQYTQGHGECPDYGNICTTTSLTHSPTQDQYVFIHDAVLESLTCGDTQIPASGLAGAIEKLKQKDKETGRTGFETQFHVRVSCLCIAVFITTKKLKVL